MINKLVILLFFYNFKTKIRNSIFYLLFGNIVKKKFEVYKNKNKSEFPTFKVKFNFTNYYKN